MSQLHIYDTMLAAKKPFQPLTPGEVKMYVCGVTVYDRCHIGHGRIFVVFDMVRRFLEYSGYRVHHVSNITDVDDKIIARAQQKSISITELTEKFTALMHEDFAQLGVASPTEEPKVSAHMDAIIAFIEQLIARDAAYVADNGDVYFKVAAYESYGNLSKQDAAALRVGARVDVVSAKRDPLDFVLWKLAKPNEPHWSSPWGEGRPGWHIECSVMAHACLGEQMDIHGGGLDLRFPHHQNELAQSECCHGKTYVNTWMHAGHVRVNEEKMSKSLGNFFTIEEVLQRYPGEVVRYFILSSHYRSPINYSDEQLELAKSALMRLYGVIREAALGENESASEHDLTAQATVVMQFTAAMNDDFNTPEALAVLFDLAKSFHKHKDSDRQLALQYARLMRYLAGLLGFLQTPAEMFLQGSADEDLAAEVADLIAQRKAARQQKDWVQADQIRDRLQAMHIELEDTADGTIWRQL